MQGLLDRVSIAFRKQHGVAPLASDLRGFMGVAHFIDQGVEPFAGFGGRHAGNSCPISVRECVLRLRS